MSIFRSKEEKNYRKFEELSAGGLPPSHYFSAASLVAVPIGTAAIVYSGLTGDLVGIDGFRVLAESGAVPFGIGAASAGIASAGVCMRAIADNVKHSDPMGILSGTGDVLTFAGASGLYGTAMGSMLGYSAVALSNSIPMVSQVVSSKLGTIAMAATTMGLTGYFEIEALSGKYDNFSKSISNKLSKVSDKIRNFLKESPDATIEKVEAKVNVKENNVIDKLQENKIGKSRFIDLTRSQINLVNSIEKWAMENKITNDNNELLRYNEKAENKIDAMNKLVKSAISKGFVISSTKSKGLVKVNEKLKTENANDNIRECR